MRQKALQSKLRASLLSLPEPQYTYEIEVPDVSASKAVRAMVPPVQECGTL